MSVDTKQEESAFQKAKERLCSITADQAERNILSVGFDAGVDAALQAACEAECKWCRNLVLYPPTKNGVHRTIDGNVNCRASRIRSLMAKPLMGTCFHQSEPHEKGTACHECVDWKAI